MLLYLFRHGEAEKGAPGEADAQRRLAPQGEAENRLCLQAVRRAGRGPEVIVSSPLVRAAQTAEMAGRILAPPGGVHEDDRLACGAQLADVRAVAQAYPAEALMLVGHNPDLSEIVGELIGDARVVLKTSGLACVSLPVVEAGAGQLEWLIKPRLFGPD
jgi:phosphohistidine phosphatase